MFGDDERRGAAAHACLRAVPYYNLYAQLRPLTRDMLYVDVDITPDFTYYPELHGSSVGELVLLIELPSGRLLHYETLHIPTDPYMNATQTYTCAPIIVPMLESTPTHLFVRLASPY
uniref:SEC63 domain-containing protein n=1 Tax=Lygus hesperus TaxID=30085 RepID=A0A0A9XLZ9_LYGHE